MIRVSVISVAMFLTALAVPPGMSQTAPSELRDIVVGNRNCGPAPLAKDVDPEGVIDREIVKPSQQEIYRHWLELIPDVARPPSSKKGKVGIEFKLSMDGKLEFVHLLSGSGDDSFDKAALGAINASTFKAIPAKAKARSIAFSVTFLYNMKCEEEPTKSN